MQNLDYNTFFDFVQQLPAGDGRFQYEEYRDIEPPSSWTRIGSLYDDQVIITTQSYKNRTHYAIGFYPFNGCDIFRDSGGRILLSYREFGGHAVFRPAFVVTKNSPFIREPICFYKKIAEKDLEVFMDFLQQFGVTKESMEADIAAYFSTAGINHDLEPGKVVIMRRFAQEKTKELQFTIIASREQAHKIATFEK